MCFGIFCKFFNNWEKSATRSWDTDLPQRWPTFRFHRNWEDFWSVFCLDFWCKFLEIYENECWELKRCWTFKKLSTCFNNFNGQSCILSSSFLHRLGLSAATGTTKLVHSHENNEKTIKFPGKTQILAFNFASNSNWKTEKISFEFSAIFPQRESTRRQLW